MSKEALPKRREFLLAMGGSAAAGSVRTEDSKPGKRTGIGLIGAGGRGSYLASVIQELKAAGEAVEIVAVCDIYQPRLERAAGRFSAKAYGTSQELLRDPAVDAVIVATPDRVHVYKALEAVEAGKDVYCEKPLTHWTQFDKLKELVRAVRSRNTVFQVGAQWVSDPVWRRAGEMIRKGSIGKPVHAQCGYFRNSDFGERGMPVDDPNARPGPGLDWQAFQADAPPREFSVSRFFQWRLYMDYSGGPATDVYPHPLTRMLRALAPGLPKKVVAVGGKYFWEGGRDVPDTFDLLIEYPQGLTVAVLGSLANDSGVDTVIRGSEGTITFSGKAGLEVTPQPGAHHEATQITSQHYEFDHLRNFLQSIRTREKPCGDLELGYVTQVPLIMGVLAFVNNKVAVFDAATEEIRLV